MEEKKYITVHEASIILGVSERQVRRYCHEGKLRWTKQGKSFLIEYESVLELQRSTLSAGMGSDVKSGMDVHEESGADGGMSNVQDATPDVRKAEDDRKKGVLKMSGDNASEPAVSDIDGHEDMNSLKRSLRFEQARNELIQARLSDLLRQLRASPDVLIKSNSRRRRDRRLLHWILWLSLLDLLGVLYLMLVYLS